MRREPKFKAFLDDVRPSYDLTQKYQVSSTYGKVGRHMAKEKSNGRQHKATYAKDKYTGGWRIRVVGPHANRFAGRVVPVIKRDDSEENETLADLVWAGPDLDPDTKEPTGKGMAAIYNFTPKPKDEDSDEIPF